VTPYEPTWKERLEDAKAYVGPAIATLLVLGVAGWAVWHELAPRREARRTAFAPADPAERASVLARLSGEVEALEKTRQRALETGAVDEATTLLDRAIAKQRERLRLDPEANPTETARLARLEAQRAEARAGAAAAQSHALEDEARTAQQAGRLAGVAEKLREALRLQREANAAAASPEGQNFPREAQLAQAIELAEAEPLHVAFESALTLAHAAVAQEHWDDALRAFADARAAQIEINRQHGTTRYASAAALGRIDDEVSTLQAAGLAATIAARERDGDAAQAAGRTQEAAASYASAADLQRQVNEKFPRSRYASVARADELAAKRDTAQAVPLVARAAGLEREIARALARRQTVAAREKITEAAGLMEKATAGFPRARAVDRALQVELSFLAQQREALDTLQSEIFAQLAPLPPTKGAQMLTTEVAQELYARVMNANPSRNAGPSLPVDSVSWFDAQEFCRRLSWVLGVRVRLPTEGELRAVFSAAPDTWSAETSGGRSHETGKSAANALGFHDLAGNVAEWLQPAIEPGDTAPVAGGSYLDSAGALPIFSVTPFDKRERARHIGFRVVVERAPE
jgi:hypothetical protein